MSNLKLAKYKNKGPSPKQRRFVELLMGDPKMTYRQAMRRAGYKSTNSTVLLRSDWVSQELEKIYAAARKESEVKQREIIQELVNIINTQVSDVFDKDMESIVPMAEWDDGLKRAIRRVKVDPKTNKVVDVGFYSKLAAMRQLASILGITKNTVNHSGEVKLKQPKLSDEELEAIING